VSGGKSLPSFFFLKSSVFEKGEEGGGGNVVLPLSLFFLFFAYSLTGLLGG